MSGAPANQDLTLHVRDTSSGADTCSMSED